MLGSYNRLPFLKLTIDSIRKEIDGITSEIIVVDGGSTDGTIKWLTRQKDIISIVQHNRGKWQGRPIERKSWGFFMNIGFKSAHGKYICMLSDDCLVIPGAIRNGYNHFEEELKFGNNIGAMAFYWREWPEQKYKVGLTLGNKMFVNHGLYLKKALEDVDYIDEDSFSFYHADGDLCLKMWQSGYACIESPDSYIEHFSHAASRVRKNNYSRQKEDWEKYLNKWKDTFGSSVGGWKEKEFHDLSVMVKKFGKFMLQKRCIQILKNVVKSDHRIDSLVKKLIKKSD